MATYQGKTVTLNKPSRIVKVNLGMVVKSLRSMSKMVTKLLKVMFGDPNMEIRKDNAES